MSDLDHCGHKRLTPGDIRCLIDCLTLALRHKNIERQIIHTHAWVSVKKVLAYLDADSSHALLQTLNEHEGHFNQSDFDVERSKAFAQALRDTLLALLSHLEELEDG